MLGWEVARILVGVQDAVLGENLELVYQVEPSRIIFLIL